MDYGCGRSYLRSLRDRGKNIPFGEKKVGSERFGDLPDEYFLYENSKVAILPIPYEVTTTFLKGTERGPGELIRASRALEFFDEELGWEPFRVGIHTLAPLAVGDCSQREAFERIEAEAKRILLDGKFLVSLGGEHSITVPLVRAALGVEPDLVVVQLDAHADLRAEYQGSPYNHACVMRRVRELCPAVQIGMRALDFSEISVVRKEGWFMVLDIERRRDPCWVKKAMEQINGPVYLTVDLDVCDPALMPAVGTPEPGGFGWYELLEFLRVLFQEKRVLASDLVELCPRPGLEHSVFTASKILYKIIGYRFWDDGRQA